MQTKKEPWACCGRVLLFSGLGQIYNGEILKGVLLMVIQVINVLLMFVVIGFVTYPLVWVYGIWDAYKKCRKV